jgi:DNA invertase Pin-like site-specific DNA recombinase
MIEAVAYLRCSGLGAGTDTWERQLEAIRAFCAAEGYELIREYREDAIAGKLDREDRPTFQQMVTELAENGCKTIIIERLDRLARRYSTQESLITFVYGAGLSLFAADTGEDVTEALMGDPMRRALIQIQGIFAELDKNMLVLKLKKARERIRASGKKCDGRKEYGFRPGEPEILATIQKLRAMGSQPETIAQHLNDMEIPTRYRKSWHAGTVSKILSRQRKVPTVSQTEA